MTPYPSVLYNPLYPTLFYYMFHALNQTRVHARTRESASVRCRCVFPAP